MRLRGLALVALLAGCTHFDPIPRGVCGNGILEPGEDCDSSDPHCVACAITCTSGSDCPQDYACGVDGTCHAPGGAFGSATAAGVFSSDDERVTDVNGDGIGDVLGISSSSISVHFGDASGALAQSIATVTPIQTSSPAFADLDGDGITDVTTAALDGIIAYTSRFGTPAPEIGELTLPPSQSSMLAGADIRALFSLDTIGAGVIASSQGRLVIAIEVIDNGASAAEATPCSGFPADEITAADVVTYRTSPERSTLDAGVDETVAIHAATGEVCVLAVHVDAATPEPFGTPSPPRAASVLDVTPPGLTVPVRPALANLDFDFDPCPDLILPGAGAITGLHGASIAASGSVRAHCGFDGTSLQPLPLDDGPGGPVPVGRIPISPTILGVAADAIVTRSGAYADVAGYGLYALYRSSRPLALVATADLDGDGGTDAVLAADGAADLDVIFRVGSSAGFVLSRLPTQGAVGTLTVGDFDGNGTQDIAYDQHLFGYDQLAVAYGFPGRLYTTLPVGAFDAVLSAQPLQIPTPSDPAGVVGDMAVLAGTPQQPTISVLEGSAERTMISYFDPRAGITARAGTWGALVAGAFGSGGATPDLLSFLATSSGPYMYRLDGVPDGFDANKDALDASGGAPVSGAGCGSGDACLATASLVAWPRADGHDVVIGIDHDPSPQPARPPRAFELDPWLDPVARTATHPRGPLDAPAVSVTAEAALVPAASVQPGMVVHGVHVIDLDGDGAPELVVAFGPDAAAPASGPGFVEVCTMDGAGQPQTCTDLTPAIQVALPGAVCVDAAPGRVRPPDDPTPLARDLIVLCHVPGAGTALPTFLVAVDAAAGSYAARVLAQGLPPLRTIQVGDITGDRVDDVVGVYVDPDTQTQLITTLPQCTSRDVACRGEAP